MCFQMNSFDAAVLELISETISKSKTRLENPLSWTVYQQPSRCANFVLIIAAYSVVKVLFPQPNVHHKSGPFFEHENGS